MHVTKISCMLLVDRGRSIASPSLFCFCWSTHCVLVVRKVHLSSSAYCASAELEALVEAMVVVHSLITDTIHIHGHCISFLHNNG
jgi:hypothetical protein